MRYRTKVTVVTGEKEYRPGMVLPEDISAADLAFLKGKGFVEPVDVESSPGVDWDGHKPDYELSGFDEREPDALKSPEEIRKLRSKKDVFGYAASLGLDLGPNYEENGLKELQEKVINFQEEEYFEDGQEEV